VFSFIFEDISDKWIVINAQHNEVTRDLCHI